MQSPPAFAVPSIRQIRSRLSLPHIWLPSRRIPCSPACSLVDRGSAFRKNPSHGEPCVGEKTMQEYLRELRIHYNTCLTEGTPNPQTVDFLRDFACFLKTHDVNITLPSLPTPANLSVNGEYYMQANRILSKIRRSKSEGKETDRLLRQPSVIGPVPRRNAFFLGIPLKYLRAHEAFHPLPTPLNVEIDSYESLTSLRQDCTPFLAAWKALPLHVEEVWPLLGFGEENYVSSLLPPTCRGHKHALRAWKKLYSPYSPRTRKRAFHERFAHERAANGALSYIIAEQMRWKSVAPDAPPWCDAVQLIETGLWVYGKSRMPLTAAPAARIVRRRENDFWMWGGVDTILITMTEDVYGSPSGSHCRFQRSKAREELDICSWIQAQFSMLCTGRYIRFADIVCYATLGGVSVFRVKRDDTFLRAGLEAVERFVVQFVETGCPPHAGFEQGQLFQSMEERIKNRFENVNRLSYVSESVAETRLMLWRRKMNDWETQRSQKPFF